MLKKNCTIFSQEWLYTTVDCIPVVLTRILLKPEKSAQIWPILLLLTSWLLLLSEHQQKWTSYQIWKIVDCACAGNAGNVFPPPRVSDPDMHHGTCVTHVPWCMSGSLTSSSLLNRWRRKRSWYSRRMRNPQLSESGKRPVALTMQDNMSLYSVRKDCNYLRRPSVENG